MALSMVAVAGLAYDAGLRHPAKLAQAVAIATAESGRDPIRLGDVGLQNATWGPSVGLWQIRSLKAERGKGTTRDQDRLTDPAHNARAMVEISRSGASWSPWTVTHPTNLAGFARYTAALPLAQTAAAELLALKGGSAAKDTAQDLAGQVLDPISNLAGTISDVAQTPARVMAWLTDPRSWVRIGYYSLGGLLLLLGVSRIVSPVAAPVVETAGAIVKKVI